MSERWWYLSFASEQGFLGAVVVLASNLLGAVRVAHVLGCNPGGEVVGGPAADGFEPPMEFRNRLLLKEDVQAMDRAILGRETTEAEYKQIHEEVFAALDGVT